jgi:hypothetical protein
MCYFICIKSFKSQTQPRTQALSTTLLAEEERSGKSLGTRFSQTMQNYFRILFTNTPFR